MRIGFPLIQSSIVLKVHYFIKKNREVPETRPSMVRHTALPGLWALMMVVSCSLSAGTDEGRLSLWRWPAALHRNTQLTAHNWWQLRKTQAAQLHIHLHQFLLTWERFHYCRKCSSVLCACCAFLWNLCPDSHREILKQFVPHSVFTSHIGY